MMNDRCMRNLIFLAVIFCNCFLNAQNNSIEFHLCGNICKIDSVTWFTESSDGLYPGPKYCCRAKTFTGVHHNERFTNNYIDPGFPGHEFVYLKDTLTFEYYAWNVIDTLKVSDFNADSTLSIDIGKDKFPVCEIHIKSDSSKTETAYRFDMYNEDEKWCKMAARLLAGDIVNELNESRSNKYFITDIYYWDVNQKKKVKFDFSFYIIK